MCTFGKEKKLGIAYETVEDFFFYLLFFQEEINHEFCLFRRRCLSQTLGWVALCLTNLLDCFQTRRTLALTGLNDFHNTETHYFGR